ncbi:probable protein phosphatase CG10417 [Musca vetustissima]|uniref:probable protein phosphatase CG10417 n=1 Tax=Musca vetustissima TaxID=27455 RepID=UPI002AB7990B|nr:probable protein phosphatase CG10417 [Musca vetustissima]
MGAYLSQPKTDKFSTDELNEFLIVGASSMQGWRNSQEDAHNAILDFDKNTAFFAVYDGHGGAEVSTYCADKLPTFLKELEAYKNGNFEQALKDAFLGFDQTLLEPAVIEILKVLASEKNNTDGDDSDALDDDEDENLVDLVEDGNLPLNQVMEKYTGHPVFTKNGVPFNVDGNMGSNDSKLQSPYLRGRRAAAIIADATNKAVLDPESKPEGSSTSKAALEALRGEGPSTSKAALSTVDKIKSEGDATVSSSSTAATAGPSSTKSSNGNATELPDSSAVKETEQNGSVSSTETKSTAVKAVNEVVSGSSDSTSSSSNTTTKQNGNVESSSNAVSSPSKKEANNASSDISSTSKEQKEKKNSTFSDNSDEEDEEELDANESNARQTLEYSSEEDLGEEDTTEDEDADYDDDDEVDDEDEDADDDMDEESHLANEQFCDNMIEEPGKDSGCTAVVGLLHGRDLYVANAGDSRCVVCRNGKAIEMSLDHKPEDDEESARIVKAGGRVTLDGRVNGGLNLSRALGDHAYKMNADLPAEEQMISALPDIKKLIISPEDEFMVLACDGIWNFMTSEEVVNFVRLRLGDENKKMSEICEELFDACLAPDTMGDGTGCDNMTAVIVRFKPKILDLPTKIDPKETEDVLLLERQNEVESSTSPEQKAQKRSASPTTDDSNEAENKTKRLKTDNNKEDGNVTQTSSSITTTTTTSSSSNAADTPDEGSGDATNNNEVASSSNVVSST